MEWILVVLIPAAILGIPIAALVIALSNRNRIRAQELKFGTLEEAMVDRRREAAALRKLLVDLEGRTAGEPAPFPAPEPARVEPVTEPVPRPEEELPLEVPASAEPAMPAIIEPAKASVEKPARRWTAADVMAKLPVWIGSVALALAGAFLVKYSVEHGLIGETTRVVLALLFGVALLVSGEWMRSRAAGVAQGLVAAGVAVLYAGLLAGINLYEIIPVVPGFILMVVVTGAAVLLSIRHGKLVAVLGIIGGFMTPQWVGLEDPEPAMLFTYLFLLQAGLMTVIRKMRWWPLAVLSLAGGIVWSLLWLSHCVSSTVPVSPRPAAYFVLASVALLVSTAFKAGIDEEGKPRWLPAGLIYGGAGSGVLVLAATVGVAEFEPIEWAFLWILSCGCLVLGRLDETYSGLPWVASGTGAIVLLSWSAGLDPMEITRFVIVTAGLGALFTVGAYAALWNSRRPDLWAVLSAVSALFYTLVGYAGLYEKRPSISWGLVCILVAALLAAMTWPVLRRRESIARGDESLAALAVGVTALVSVAAPIELERAWIAVVWAVEIPALAWIAHRLRIPVLARLAWGLVVLVAVRLLLNPAVLDYPIGESLVFNWLLYGYGVPMAAFVAGTWLFRRYGDEPLSRTLEAGTLVLGFWWVNLAIRHAFHPTAMDNARFTNPELYTYSAAWILLAVALLVAAFLTRRVVLRYGSAAIMALAVFKVFLVDTGNLTGLYRVFSLLGLGVTLLALAYVYQRYVFRPETGEKSGEKVNEGS